MINKKKKEQQPENEDDLPNLKYTYHEPNQDVPIDLALYGDYLDKQLGVKPNRRRGDDECTEENDEDYVVDPYNLDEK